MLIAYLDEFGHVGPYVSREDKRFNDHPVFGYGGYIIPAENARYFSSEFVRVKRNLFKTEIEKSDSPAQWERKGAEYFSTGSIEKRPELVRAFLGLVRKLENNGGKIFYYGDEKPRGTMKQTNKTSEAYTVEALRESINRICRHADNLGRDVVIFMDDFTEKTRREVVGRMYGHIYARSSYNEEMRRIVEPPLHIDSKMNSSVQFADWICGLVGRAADYQLVPNSKFGWTHEQFEGPLTGTFTYESKIRTEHSKNDLNHSQILRTHRTLERRGPIGSVGRENPGLAAFYNTLKPAVS